MASPKRVDPLAEQKRQNTEIARLRSKSTLYANNVDGWVYYQSAYQGGKRFVNKNTIFRHSREHQKDYDARLERAYYHNLCRPIVDFFGDFIFKETIQRNGGDDNNWYQEFITNVNKKGEDITAFMKDVCAYMQVYGMVYVLTDSPRLAAPGTLPNGRRITKADEKKLGLRPYFVMMRPLEIFDWVTDAFDQFLYVKRSQEITDVNPDTGDVTKLERYTEWTKNKIRITDIDVSNPTKPVLRAPEMLNNALGEIPIDVFRYARDMENPFMAISFLVDLADLNRAIMNTNSLEMEYEYRQCFNILVLEAEADLPYKEQEEGETGVNNAIVYPKGGKAPEYISPNPEPAKYMSDKVVRLKSEMFALAAQDMVSEMFNGGRASGHSKAMSFSTTVPRIASRADILERGEHTLMKRVYAYRRQQWQGTIRYKDRYEITNLTDMLAQLSLLFKDLQMPSPTFLKETLKRVVHELDGKLPANTISQIEGEINKMNTDEWFDTQKLALIGRAGQSPEVGTAFGDGGNPKDKPASSATPTRSQSTTRETASESTKEPVGAKPKNKPKG
jgi:hypothetical protein